MIRKFTIYNLQFTILITALIFAFLLLTTGYKLPTAYADSSCLTQSPSPRVQSGLISALDITNFGNATGQCVIGSNAPFVPYKIPGYDDLKSIYYTQSKATKVSSSDNKLTPINSNDDGKVFNYTAQDVNTNGTYNYNGTAVIFIDGNINIKNDIKALDSTKGLVLVVKNNVNIDPSVTQIDAVIIAQGTICTAFDGTNCSTSNTQLVINGSLISIGSDSIQFTRSLTDNSSPAEKIIQQPKYLVILRNLMSDTLQKWAEIP